MEIELGSMDENEDMALNPELLVRGFERKYFSDVHPAIASVEVFDNGDKPGYYNQQTNTIHINKTFLRFDKSCKIVLLHELVHSKLHKRDGDADKPEGSRFQTEIGELWKAGAYKKIL